MDKTIELIDSKLKMVNDPKYFQLIAKELELEDPENAQELLGEYEIKSSGNNES